MDNINKNIYRILLIVAIGLFFFLKLADCYLPYFWDELGVYSRAALFMYDHKVSLLPADLPVELSRGHPLLFAFIYGTWFKVFGTSVLFVHLFSLLISILLVVTTYLFGKKYFSEQTGLIAAILLLIQPVFIAQSTLVLPEVMLALFCLLSIYYYLNHQYIVSGLLGGLAILTKETAIVMPLAFFLTELLRNYHSSVSFKQTLKNSVGIFIPYYAFLAFIFIQRIQNGWFFFPCHVGFISLDPENIYYRTHQYFKFIFFQQGRLIWALLLIFTLVTYWYSHQKQTWQNFISFFKMQNKDQFIYFTLILYILGVIGFSGLNFPLNRYLLLMFPPICILIAQLVSIIKKPALLITAVLFLFCPLFYISNDHFVNDEDMSFRYVVEVQKEVSDYFNENPQLSKDKLIIVDFPLDFGFMDTRAGYINNINYRIGNTASHYNPEADFYLYSLPGNLSDGQKIPAQLELVKEFQASYAKAYIYRRK
jgi:4-amino-4-deoxy-L-arabinose transferase-like glycosyltransferase